MLSAWDKVITATDAWLDAVTAEILLTDVTRSGGSGRVAYGDLMLRNIYHYWYHTGENAGIRQALGHSKLPDFVGDFEEHAPYRPG